MTTRTPSVGPPSRTALLKGVMEIPCSISRVLVSVSMSPMGPIVRTKCPIGYCESPGQESMQTTILCTARNVTKNKGKMTCTLQCVCECPHAPQYKHTITYTHTHTHTHARTHTRTHTYTHAHIHTHTHAHTHTYTHTHAHTHMHTHLWFFSSSDCRVLILILGIRTSYGHTNTRSDHPLECSALSCCCQGNKHC